MGGAVGGSLIYLIVGLFIALGRALICEDTRKPVPSGAQFAYVMFVWPVFLIMKMLEGFWQEHSKGN